MTRENGPGTCFMRGQERVGREENKRGKGKVVGKKVKGEGQKR